MTTAVLPQFATVPSGMELIRRNPDLFNRTADCLYNADTPFNVHVTFFWHGVNGEQQPLNLAAAVNLNYINIRRRMCRDVLLDGGSEPN